MLRLHRLHRLDFLAFSKFVKQNLVQAEIHFLKTFLNYLKELVEADKVAQEFDRGMVGLGSDTLDHNPTVVVHSFLRHPLNMVVAATFLSMVVAPTCSNTTYNRHN